MTAYVAVEGRQNKMLVEKEKAFYIPPGWSPPSKSYYLGDWAMKHPIKHPVTLRKASVRVPGLIVRANEARIVDDDTCKEIEDIDNQVLALKQKRREIIDDRFLTFDLVKEGDLQTTNSESRYPTKQEALAKAEGK